MRKTLLLAALLAATPLAAVAQTATPPAPLALSAEQRTALNTAVARGRALAVLDQAYRLASADARSRIPAADAAAITGWIAQPEGNGVAVTYYVAQGGGYAAIYKASVLGGRVNSPRLYAAANRPTLDGVAARMAAARAAAEAVAHQACGPDFNTFVLPPAAGEPVLVYRLSPRMAANRVPGGGHFRLTVAADNSIAEDVALGGTCANLTIAAAPARGRPRPIQVNAAGKPLPSELHVFLALWTQRPLVVAAGEAPVRLWGVTGEGIAELQQ